MSTTAHTVTMGRWATHTLEATSSDGFWVTMAIRHRVCEPSERCRHFVESAGQERQKTGAGALAHLTWSDADPTRQCVTQCWTQMYMFGRT